MHSNNFQTVRSFTTSARFSLAGRNITAQDVADVVYLLCLPEAA